MKFIPIIDNEHAQDYSCPGGTSVVCSLGEKLPRQSGLPTVVQRVVRLSKTHVDSNRRQTKDRGKGNLRVTDLPRVHVNRPYFGIFGIYMTQNCTGSTFLFLEFYSAEKLRTKKFKTNEILLP